MRIPRLRFGPATLVAAAFIGPGTVVTASMAGAGFGYGLLWALLFAIIATLILQEMALRIGVVTGQGLGENLRVVVERPLPRMGFLALVVAAVVIGNSAYQGGNLTGASLGAMALWPDAAWVAALEQRFGINPWATILGALAILVLWQGQYRRIERILIALVMLMSLAFLTTFLMSRPDIPALLRGLLLPSVPEGGALTMMALIGTTVVPYALFLHAASARERWAGQGHDVDVAMSEARADLYTSVPLGGIVTLAILSTSAAAWFGREDGISGAADLALSLEPVFGQAAVWLMAIGLLAAGLSSAITAPLASAYALTGALGWSTDMKGLPFRATWLSIVLIGVTVASLGLEPIALIVFAQVANGILLPLIAGFLLLAVNHFRMGEWRNSAVRNAMGAAVLLVALLLGLRSIWLALS